MGAEQVTDRALFRLLLSGVSSTGPCLPSSQGVKTARTMPSSLFLNMS